VDIKKICEYPHNGYPHRYGYEYETNIYLVDRSRTLSAPLTSLIIIDLINYNKFILVKLIKKYSCNNILSNNY